MKNSERRYILWWVISGLILLAMLSVIVIALTAQHLALIPKAFIPQTGQEEYVQAFEIGIRYWQAGDMEKASDAFSKAALSAQPKISTPSLENLSVVLAEKNSFLGGTRALLRRFSPWFSGTVLFFLGIIFAFFIIFGIIAWQTRHVKTWVNLVSDLSPNQMGKGFDQNVYHIIRQAREVYQKAQMERLVASQPYDLPVLPTDIPWSLSTAQAFDTIQVGPVSLDWMRLAPAVTRLTMIGIPHVNVTLSKDGEKTILFLQTKPEGWMELPVQIRGNGDNALEDLTVELAYRILQHLAGKQTQTQTWRSFQCLTAGLLALQYSRDGGILQQEVKNAKHLFEKALDVDPGCLLASYTLGQTNMLLGDFKTAQQNFFDLLEKMTDQPDMSLSIHYYIGLTFYYQFMDKLFIEAWKHFEIVRTPLAATQQRTTFQDTLLGLVLAAEAALAAEWSWRIPVNTQEVPKNTEIGWYLAGDDFCQKALALSTHLSRNQREPIELSVEFARGMLALRRAQGAETPSKALQKEAAGHFETLFTRRPDFTGAYIFYAHALEKGKLDIERAKQLYRRAAEQELAGSPYAWYRLGELYRQEGERAGNHDQVEQARELYDHAPEFGPALKASGRLLAKEGQLLNALDKFRAAVKINRRDDEAWGEIAWRIMESKTRDTLLLDEAEHAALTRLKLTCGNRLQEAQSRMYLGLVLLSRGRVDEAVRELKCALELDDTFQRRHHLAEALVTTRRTAEAIELLKLGLSTHPGKKDPWFQRCKEMLHKLEHGDG